MVGNPAWQEQTVSLALRPNGDRQHRTVVDAQAGKPAVTHLKVLERFGHTCLVEAIPETGRTHQIRAHLYAVGLSILGDKLYGKRKTLQDGQTHLQSQQDYHAPIGWAEGMALHALSLQIDHPQSGERLKFIAPYPETLRLVLEHLRAQFQTEG